MIKKTPTLRRNLPVKMVSSKINANVHLSIKAGSGLTFSTSCMLAFSPTKTAQVPKKLVTALTTLLMYSSLLSSVEVMLKKATREAMLMRKTRRPTRNPQNELLQSILWTVSLKYHHVLYTEHTLYTNPKKSDTK